MNGPVQSSSLSENFSGGGLPACLFHDQCADKTNKNPNSSRMRISLVDKFQFDMCFFLGDLRRLLFCIFLGGR